MCGILAYFKAEGLSKADLIEFQSALDTMRHRGPNGDGILLINSRTGKSWHFQTADRPSDLTAEIELPDYADFQADLVLGHRRLSIFDLSSMGHQPMRDAFGNVIIFNGEVYNFIELRDELKRKGHSFATGTDTEVILAAYREWGAGCFSRFNGMWSIVMFDARTKQVVLSNDRIGIKQLYHWGNATTWAVASEIKAIRKFAAFKPELDNGLVSYFLLNGQIDLGSATLFKGLVRLKPSHVNISDPRNFLPSNSEAYWDFPSGSNAVQSLEEAALELRSLLDDAVRLRMRSDVPWGTTLSGGLDSSAIVYAAHRLRQQQGLTAPIHTFTASFPGTEADEAHHVRQIEQDLGLDATYTQPMEAFDFDEFKRFCYHQDMPIPNTTMFAQWSVMKSVVGTGVTVLLDGQGGDELFGGYHHHFYKYGRSLMLAGKIGQLKQLVAEYAELKGWNPTDLMKTIRQDFKLWVKLKLGRKLPGPSVVTEWSAATKLREVLMLDIRNFVMPSLLRYEDRNSMAFSLEARLPFLDYRIVEFAMRLPDQYKINGGWQKYILRKAMPEMPESITWRKDKKGFSTPHDAWMKMHQAEFKALAAKGMEAFDADPFPGRKYEDLDPMFQFRLASLGIWLKLS